MSELTTYDYAKTIEALYEHLNRNHDEWWVRGIIVKMQLKMRETIYDNK